METNSNKVLLTVITVNLNNAEGLRKTLESITSQTSDDYRQIIIDGASTDKSIEILQKFSHYNISLISEPDSGIYEAMNKGILKATGDYLLFLNSGDTFFSNDIVARFIAGNHQEEIVSGDIVIKKNNNSEDFHIKASPVVISPEFLFNEYLPHSGTFIKRTLFDRAGLYNENNKIVSDWEFFLKALLIHNASYLHIPYCVSVFNTDGVSCKPENAKLIEKEKQNVLQLFFPYFVQEYADLSTYEKYRKHKSVNREFKTIFSIKIVTSISVIAWFKRMVYKYLKSFIKSST